ncbi:MAG: hypothetical protein ABIJ21_04155 [Nanoarchaeota archaeon]
MDVCSTQSCKRPATVRLSYTPARYCDKHFLYHIEKRVRKHLREKKEIRANETYVLKPTKTKEYAIAQHFLKSIFKSHITLKKKGSEKEIIPTNLDKENSQFIEMYLQGKIKKMKKEILILEDVMNEELMQIARILKIPAKPEAQHPIIAAMEKKHPGTQFALRKSRKYHETIYQAFH